MAAKRRSRRSLAAPGLTEQQDRFARQLALGVDVESAWHEAGYRLGPSNAKHRRRRAEALAADPRIVARVADLATEAEPVVRQAIARGAEALVMDAVARQHFVRDRLARIADTAIAERSYNAAMEALDMLGRDAGMWPAETTSPPRNDRAAARAGAIAGAAAGSVLTNNLVERLQAARRAQFGQPVVVDVEPEQPALAAPAPGE